MATIGVAGARHVVAVVPAVAVGALAGVVTGAAEAAGAAAGMVAPPVATGGELAPGAAQPTDSRIAAMMERSALDGITTIGPLRVRPNMNGG